MLTTVGTILRTSGAKLSGPIRTMGARAAGGIDATAGTLGRLASMSSAPPPAWACAGGQAARITEIGIAGSSIPALRRVMPGKSRG